MGSDCASELTTPIVAISTHAPAWGATGIRPVMLQFDGISTHAPAWGATIRTDRHTMNTLYFNPRSRVGSDQVWRSGTKREKFQPTLPRGERRGADTWFPFKKSLFQPTLPRGERPIVWINRWRHCHFNPRSRVGSDQQSWTPRSR